MRVASLSGMPTSAAIVRPISSARAFRPSWIFERKAARSAGGVVAQPSNAARAAAAAASTSAGVPSGTRPMISSVDGETTAMVLAPAAADQRPATRGAAGRGEGAEVAAVAGDERQLDGGGIDAAGAGRGEERTAEVES